MITEVVTFTREINPLWVPHLVTHEVKVTLATESQRENADHLVQGHATIDFEAHGLITPHPSIYLRVEEPHGLSLIANDGLIVRLSVTNALLLPSTVRHAMSEVAHVPILIWRLLQQLDPKVWDEHAKSVIEAHASIFDRSAEGWHA